VERDADRLGDCQDHQACGHQDHRREGHQDADHQGSGADRHQDAGHPHHQGAGHQDPGANHQDPGANHQDLDETQEGRVANPQEQCAGQGVSQHLDAVVDPNEVHQAAVELLDPWLTWAAVAAELGVLQETTDDQEPVAPVDGLRAGAAQVVVPQVALLEQRGRAATK